jgi:hypothetical protein
LARFSIRDCLWLTLAVALALAWTLDRGQLARRADQQQKTIDLYRKYGLDRTLEQLRNSPPRRPAVFIPAHLLPRRLYGSPIFEYQLPPPDRTPWIERIERQVIEAKRTGTNRGR